MAFLTGILAAFGLSASAGLNAYIPLLVIGLLARFTDLITLQPPWDALSSWWILGLLIVLSLVEFFADKIPAINHINDLIQTFVRPVAGAIVFAASTRVISDIHPILAMAAGLLTAGAVHAVKTVAVRPTVTVTTAGTGNVPVSILEDAAATFLSVMAVVLPVLAAVIVVFLLFLICWWILRKAPAKGIP